MYSPTCMYLMPHVTYTLCVLQVQFQADKYTGAQVIHCHILEHEDEVIT